MKEKKSVDPVGVKKPVASADNRVKMKAPDGTIAHVKPQHVPARQYQGFVLVEKKEV